MVPERVRDSSFFVAGVPETATEVELMSAGVPLRLALVAVEFGVSPVTSAPVAVCEGASPATEALVDVCVSDRPATDALVAVCASPALDSDNAPFAGAVPVNVAVADEGTWMDVNVGVVVTEQVEELNVDETPVTTETDWKVKVTATVPAGVGKVIGMPAAGKVMPVALSYETVPPLTAVALSYETVPPVIDVVLSYDTVPPVTDVVLS